MVPITNTLVSLFTNTSFCWVCHPKYWRYVCSGCTINKLLIIVRFQRNISLLSQMFISEQMRRATGQSEFYKSTHHPLRPLAFQSYAAEIQVLKLHLLSGHQEPPGLESLICSCQPYSWYWIMYSVAFNSFNKKRLQSYQHWLEKQIESYKYQSLWLINAPGGSAQNLKTIQTWQCELLKGSRPDLFLGFLTNIPADE